ncbi:NAD(P)H-hydrate dehydratase [Candidatus Neomarinimicrobiota bacterium]
MNPVLTTDISRALDQFTIRSGRITEVDLMRNAGRAVALEASKMLGADTDAAILIVCGKGHNGGDGIAAAGFLTQWGYSPDVQLLGKVEDMDETVSVTYQEAGIEATEDGSADGVDVSPYDLIIDALLGIGVEQPVRSPVSDWVKSINTFHGPVLAIDIPSGLITDTGEIAGSVIKADVTVTMGYPKLGLLINVGPDLAGRLVVADIGFESDFFQEMETEPTGLLNRTDFAGLFQPPARRTFKHRQGKTLVIAGSIGMTGAAVLTARATMASGSGLTVAACPASIQLQYVPMMPEVITLSLEDHGRGMFLPEHAAAIRESLEWCSAVVLGPGLSRSPQVKEFVRNIFEYLETPTLLDADGLTPFNGNVDLLSSAEIPLVITPHAKEFARLFDHDVEEVSANPAKALSEVRAYFHHTVVLKGAPTVTLFSTGEIVINSTGNSGLATAGSGDVLSGVIGTFLSQGYRADEAASMGVWLHGYAGDLARRHYGAPGMTSLHLLEQLPHALAEFDYLQ